jgi:LPS export ABC transporter protein LptC
MLKAKNYFFHLILLGGVAFGFSCKNQKEDVNKIEKVIPTETATNITLYYSDSAKLKAKLVSPLMIRYISDTNPLLELPKTLQIQFYDHNQVPDAHLRANYGLRIINKNKTILKGNVVVVNQIGDTFKSEELIWLQDKKKVYTKKFVRVKTAKDIVLAEGFESNESFTKYKFFKVKATILIKE